ncbi:MAG: hypothetical protein JNJ88_06425 [Planctomycetes bacterium]|nr:hypothetical protein [Planctomycetota bacterium]
MRHFMLKLVAGAAMLAPLFLPSTTAARGGGGYFLGNFQVTLKANYYPQTTNPADPIWNDQKVTRTYKGVLSAGDSAATFGSLLSLSGTLQSTDPLGTPVVLDLAGIRTGRSIRLGSQLFSQIQLDGLPPSYELLGRVTINKNTQRVTSFIGTLVRYSSDQTDFVGTVKGTYLNNEM